MKKIFILFLILGVGRLFSQSVIYTEDFSAPTTSKTADWAYNNNGTYPTCNVSGTSGGAKLVATNGSTSFQTVTTPAVSTSTYVNIQVSWNMLRATASSPALTFQWSSNGGSTWNTAVYSAPSSTAVWAAVPTVTLPAGANLGTIYLRWTYTGTGGVTNYVEIDDVKITGTPTPSYYYKGSGALDNVANWGTNTDGSGANPIDFVTANQNFFLQNISNAVLTNNWTITGVNSFMNIGDGTSGNKCNLTIPATFVLTMGTGAKLNVNNSSTLTIQNTSFPTDASVNLASNSTVDFAQASAVTLWDVTYGNLILSGIGDRDQSNSNFGLTVVTGNFVIGALNNYVMVNSLGAITELQGKITCNGNITAGLSNLTIDGSSSNTIGTLNFNGSNTINDLVLNRSSQTLTLGSDLTVSGVLSATTFFTSGNLSLNGKSFTIGGAVTFPATTTDGVITGSTSSSLTINGSGTITNNLLMDQTSTASKSLGMFAMNRSATTLALGNDLIVGSSALFTTGNVDLNGNLLTLNGAVTFPTNASNGVLVGSTTSSLIISTSVGPLTNNLFMDQTTTASKSLGTFSISVSSLTLTLGNSLIVSGNSYFPNGVIDLNGTLLTLNGPIVLPALVSNRGFKGSLTSSLTVGGSGSISNSLLMNASNNILGELTMNRSGQTLNLGNTLVSYGSVNPTAGTIGSGGFLFIRSDATNKGRIGPVGGSLTGNVKVETFALGGTTGWTNLGPSGINGLTIPSWEGQIPMTCISCPNGPYAAGPYFVSIQRWDETQAGNAAYVPMNYSDALNVGQGYWTYLGNSNNTTSDMTWTVQGTAVQGPVSLPLTFSGSSNGNGYNLISNPYASPISWDAVLASNPTYTSTLDNAIYVYNPDLGVSTSYVSGVGSSTVNGITDAIPMGQGFYVQTTVSNYTLTIQEADKIKSNAPLLKTTNNVGAVVRLYVAGGGRQDGTAIRFHSDATTGFDKQLDAYKLFSSPGYAGATGANTKGTTISTKSEDLDYSVNSLPNAVNEDAVIPVLVKVYSTGQYTLSGSQFESLPNSCVILKDKLTNATQDLKTGNYVCTINDTTAAPRFELRVCADLAMSVKSQKNIDQYILINNDVNGAYIKFDFDKPTKSVISVTNILGQKIIDDKSVTVAKDKVTIDIPEKHQLIFVTVTSDNNKVTKKIIR